MHRFPRALRAPFVFLALLVTLLGSPVGPQLRAQLPHAGSLLLLGGGELPDAVRARFARLAGGSKGLLVIVPSASARAGLVGESYYSGPWSGLVGKIRVVHAKNRAQAETPEFAKQLSDATGLWFGGGQQSRLLALYRATPFEQQISALLARGGVVGGSSAGAAALSKIMIVGGKQKPRFARGFDLVPQAIVDQHFSQRQRLPRLLAAVHQYPQRFGLGIDESTAVLLRGRRLRVLGRGKLTIVLPPWSPVFARATVAPLETPPSDTRVLAAGALVDFVALQRTVAARQRAPVTPGRPGLRKDLVKGSLLLVGGGRMRMALWKRFVALAGSSEAALIVVPTAAGDRVSPEMSYAAQMLRSAGAKNVQVWHAATRQQADDGDFCAPLLAARGIWFSGGRQWRLVDRYEGTRAERLFARVLAKGGVLGGSSAGCSIHAECMVRGNPLGNREILSEGYERGFGYLAGCAVDQHFSQRKREPDLRRLVDFYPSITGIGIDEGTAILVRRSEIEVLGRAGVLVLEAQAAIRLHAGDRYQLKAH